MKKPVATEPSNVAHVIVKAGRVAKVLRPVEHAATDPTARSIEGKGGDQFHPTTLAAMLSLDEVTMRVIDLRLGLMYAIRELRQEAGITQAELAKRLGVSRPRVVEMESVDREPTFDSLLPAFFAAGGTAERLCAIVKKTDESMSF